MATDIEIKPGTRVMCLFDKSKGYSVRDEGMFLSCVGDAGGCFSSKKEWIAVLDEVVPPAIVSLCESLELEHRRGGFAIRDNHDMERDKLIAEEEVRVCIDALCDLYSGIPVEYEFEFRGEKKKAKLPLFPEKKTKLDKSDIWDTSMLGGIIRGMAEKRLHVKDMADIEKELMEGE